VLFSRLSVCFSLEIEAKDELNQSAAGIRGGRGILVSNCCLSESWRRVRTRKADRVCCEAANLEVLVIDYVQRLHTELQIRVFREVYFLNQARIDSGEARSIDHQVCNAALSVEPRLAIAKARRRDERLSHIRRRA
jgi:hypothetical protein